VWSQKGTLAYFQFTEGEVAGKAKCDGDYESGAYWTDVRVFKTCNNNGDSSDDSDTDSDSTDDDEDDEATVMGHISLEDRLKELADVCRPFPIFSLF